VQPVTQELLVLKEAKDLPAHQESKDPQGYQGPAHQDQLALKDLLACCCCSSTQRKIVRPKLLNWLHAQPNWSK
jgi:hypothetical protein